jgi:hypothetical protein
LRLGRAVVSVVNGSLLPRRGTVHHRDTETTEALRAAMQAFFVELTTVFPELTTVFSDLMVRGAIVVQCRVRRRCLRTP